MFQGFGNSITCFGAAGFWQASNSSGWNAQLEVSGSKIQFKSLEGIDSTNHQLVYSPDANSWVLDGFQLIAPESLPRNILKWQSLAISNQPITPPAIITWYEQSPPRAAER